MSEKKKKKDKKDVSDDELKDMSGGRTVEIDDSDLTEPDDTGTRDNPRPVGRPGSW